MTRYYQGVPYGGRKAEESFTERNEEVLEKEKLEKSTFTLNFFTLERDDSARIDCSQEWPRGGKRGE